MFLNKLLICIPTYNESENVKRIFLMINELNLGADVLFIDDHSPDGTGEIIDRLAEQHANLFVIHRAGKLGVGSAHMEGIHWAYQNHYAVLITMDCDFSHSPKYLPRFIAESSGYDVVIASRFKKKKSLNRWKFMRKILTHAGYFSTRIFLGLPYDSTGAFRVYQLNAIPEGVFGLIRSHGYSFFFESLYILHRNKFKIKEVSIYLPARTYGHSKMRIRDARDSLSRLVNIFLRRLISKKSFTYPYNFISDNKIIDSAVQGRWDKYWTAKNNPAGFIYDVTAYFYRKFIIKYILNHFSRKYFYKGSKVLHAGCGSGQVDTDLIKTLRISALDISIQALNIYKKNHGNNCDVIHGTIFNIPVPDKNFDGIYNLGVMEHFTCEEIQVILSEFNRILKDSGKVLLFWPPEFGLSVKFLRAVHYVFNSIFKINMKLHPEEITRLHSREQAEVICSSAGFSIVEYYFGIRDMFTYCVLVLSKNIDRISNQFY